MINCFPGWKELSKFNNRYLGLRETNENIKSYSCHPFVPWIDESLALWSIPLILFSKDIMFVKYFFLSFFENISDTYRCKMMKLVMEFREMLRLFFLPVLPPAFDLNLRSRAQTKIYFSLCGRNTIYFYTLKKFRVATR